MIGLRGPPEGKRCAATADRPLRVPRCNWTQPSSRTPPGPAPEPAHSSVPPGSGSGAPPLPRRRPRRNYLDKTDAAKEPKNRQSGRLLAFGPKEKVNIEPKEAVSEKEVSSKKIATKASLKNIRKRVSSKSIENKDIPTNLQSDLWSSSFLKEITGGGGKDAVIAKKEKNNEYCLQDTDDKLSESTDDEGEDNTNDENDDDEDSSPKKETRAPLELMAEFLRAEMGRDYHLAKKLCQMILIYEPENPEAKEFLSLIEEMLLMEKAQNLEEEEDSEEDGSCESEEDSGEDVSQESSDECEDGS